MLSPTQIVIPAKAAARRIKARAQRSIASGFPPSLG
jgi:hypothetical protein